MNLDTLIHPPWWAAALILAAGAGIFWSGNRRLDKAMKRLGLGIALLGLLLGIAGLIFPSDRQRMESRAKNIVAAVDKNDWNRLGSLLDENTAVGTITRDISRGRNAIVKNVQSKTQTLNVSSVSAISTDSSQVDTDITVVMKIGARSGAYFDRPFIVDCQFDFQKSGDRWLLEKITLLRMDGENAESIFTHAMY